MLKPRAKQDPWRMKAWDINVKGILWHVDNVIVSLTVRSIIFITLHPSNRNTMLFTKDVLELFRISSCKDLHVHRVVVSRGVIASLIKIIKIV